jgi:hypothetical protein
MRRCITILLICVAPISSADTDQTAIADASYGYLSEDDPQNSDVEDSLEYPYQPEGSITFGGDLRGGFFAIDSDQRNTTSDSSDEFAARLRYGVNFSVTEGIRFKSRFAVTCDDDNCDPDVDISSRPSAGNTTEGGDIVLDEFYLDIFERGRFDVAFGRMQTRAVTRGGVFISSLTRLTSPNVAINWTDGVALRYQAASGWDSKLIAQYNDSDGSSTLARPPLDFDDDDSRISFFYSLENREPWGPFTQRALDVSFMPEALLTEGVADGDRDDYWNIATRLAAQWPQNPSGASVIVSGELGWAPETPSEAAVSTGGSGDSGGVAWHAEASWMNFLPGHSMGVNYGQTDSGWLISPVYRANDETFALRYHWRPIPRAQVEVNVRWREDLDKFIGADQRREQLDWRLRLTWLLERRS